MEGLGLFVWPQNSMGKLFPLGLTFLSVHFVLNRNSEETVGTLLTGTITDVACCRLIRLMILVHRC
jgi:hypothetical protein